MLKHKHIAALILGTCLLLSGCLEQLSTTRVAGGAAHNFFYFLSLDQPNEAEAYWAPDFVPADSQAQVNNAIALMKPYEFQQSKITSTPDDTGVTVVLSGKQRLKGSQEWSADTNLMTAHLIERGPGYRLTSFQILCCNAPGATTTPSAKP